MGVVGIVLAAGAGRRMGAPKALLRHVDGRTFAAATAELLVAAGCSSVLVTLGTGQQLPSGVVAVEVPDASRGPGAGLARALRHPLARRAEAVLITLVDLPGIDVAGVRAVLGLASPTVLARGVERGRPGHPVLIGREHVARALELADTGSGLNALFGEIPWTAVEVPGAAADVDHPEDLPPGTRSA
ncbi:NTP transferase domain-containing protein [Kineococcus sp. NBC_00420]|uniref:nucleotidyltransferase family protein n=1 Tax=Kineococcus sp. NBC_00420 TaxID=2903564 RepID=UPI002E1A6B6F